MTFVLTHSIRELIRWFIYKQMYLNEDRKDKLGTRLGNEAR